MGSNHPQQDQEKHSTGMKGLTVALTSVTRFFSSLLIPCHPTSGKGTRDAPNKQILVTLSKLHLVIVTNNNKSSSYLRKLSDDKEIVILNNVWIYIEETQLNEFSTCRLTSSTLSTKLTFTSKRESSNIASPL